MESQHTEWKESWRDEWLKWVSAFANSEGGTLTIGRNDKGQAIGVKDAPRLLEELPNKVRDLLGMVVEVKLVQESGLQLIDILVEPYPTPISYKGTYHVRSGSTKQELKGAALDKFLLSRQGRHWDGAPQVGANFAQLAPRAIADFRKRAMRSQRLSTDDLEETDAALIEKLRLIAPPYLKRAAVLLFHPDPERFITGAYIKIGSFLRNDILRFQDEVHGDLLSQATQTVAILKAKYLTAAIEIVGLQRSETLPIPEAALREALMNAIVHKDYASGIPIQISVYPHKLMIWNPGQLPSSWTLQNLLNKHPSIAFNPDVANTFFRAGIIESWGSGIERILQACRVVGLPAPSFAHDAAGMFVTFFFSPTTLETEPTTLETTPKLEPTTLEIESTTLETEGTTLETEPTTLETEDTTLETEPTTLETTLEQQPTTLETEPTTLETIPEQQPTTLETEGTTLETEPTTLETTLEQQPTTLETEDTTLEKILAILQLEPKTSRRGLANRLGLTLEGVRYHINRLKAAGRLTRQGPTKGGQWHVRNL